MVQRVYSCDRLADMIKVPSELHYDRAQAVGLTFVGPYTKNSERTQYLCAVHGIIEMQPANVLQGRGCRLCAHENLKGPRKDVQLVIDKIRSAGLNFIGPYVSHSESFLVSCKKHGEFRVFASNVMRDTSKGQKPFRGCKTCFEQSRVKTDKKLQEEAALVNLEYLEGYSSNNIKCKYLCKVHGVIEMIPANVYVGCGCRKCSRNGKNLEKQKTFYIVDVFYQTGEHFLTGYGITYSIGRRMGSYKHYVERDAKVFKLVDSHTFNDWESCSNFEKFVKMSFKPVTTNITGFKSESLCHSDRNTVLSLLGEFKCPQMK